METRSKKPGSGHSQNSEINWRSFVTLAFVILLGYYFFESNQIRDTTTISYSEFVDQVKQDNVSKLTVKGNEIEGTFSTDYLVTANGDTTSFSMFTTVRPFQDPRLLALLESHDVLITARSEEGSSAWQMLLLAFLPWLLVIGYFVYVSRRMKGQAKSMMGGGLFGVGKSRAKRYREEESKTTFDDVAGLDNVKRDLSEVVEYLKNPEKFTALGADIPKGILLVGPPGTGKTLLARATAGEAGVTFYNISGSEFIEMFVGVGASRVRDMFENAKREAPAIIFIDEMDSIGRARGTGLGGGHDEREQTLNQILSEMDGFQRNQSVIILAATNRPDVLDPALTRPGRFDRQLTLELPQKSARQKIFEIHLKKVKLSRKVDVAALAARTVGFSGADIRNMVNEAALRAGRKGNDEVTAADLDDARDRMLLGQVREDLIGEKERKMVAYHESGHALLAWLTPGADPLKKVTIIPRGRSLGATEQMPEEDRHNLSRSFLLNRIAIALGGRAAEKLVFDDISIGAANDLKRVTEIARRMVCQWGMSEKIGPVTFNQGADHPFLGREIANHKDFSDQTGRLIDEEIQAIILDMERKAQNLLNANRDKLDDIAVALLETETLEERDIDRILGSSGSNESNSKKTTTASLNEVES